MRRKSIAAQCLFKINGLPLYIIKPTEMHTSCDDIRLRRWYTRMAWWYAKPVGLDKKLSFRRTRVFTDTAPKRKSTRSGAFVLSFVYEKELVKKPDFLYYEDISHTNVYDLLLYSRRNHHMLIHLAFSHIQRHYFHNNLMPL